MKRLFHAVLASALALTGFFAIILNFTVVNLVFQGLHSYAGV